MNATPVAAFRQMKDSTREDWLLLDAAEKEYSRRLADRVLAALRALAHGDLGYPVNRLEHSLQTATRARRDGADDELVFAALLHDIGDELAPANHSEFAAAIIRPYVRAEVSWIVEQHGLFQGYYYAHYLGGDRNARLKYKEHPWYHACAHFCAAWDQNSFDPDYQSDPLESFEPLVRAIFARAPHTATG